MIDIHEILLFSSERIVTYQKKDETCQFRKREPISFPEDPLIGDLPQASMKRRIEKSLFLS